MKHEPIKLVAIITDAGIDKQMLRGDVSVECVGSK